MAVIEIVKYCCVLSNCDGSKLILGITDKRLRRVMRRTVFEQPECTVTRLTEKLRIRE
jgi:ATP-dependent DNA helicase RecG